MWPIGSAPVVDGAPPVRRTQWTSGTGEYPATGPPTRRRRVRRAAPVHPERAVGGRLTGIVDRNRAAPLAGAAHRDDVVRIDRARRRRLAVAGREDHRPPLGGVLHRSAVVEQPRLDRGVLVPRDATVEGDDRRPSGLRSRGRLRARHLMRPARGDTAGHATGREARLRVHHPGHHRADEVVGFVGHPSGDAAVDRTRRG